MILMPGSIPGLRRFFFLHPTMFDRSTISDRLRFALRAHGLRQLLRKANSICAPCGREQGAKWDHIGVGSGPGGIRRAKQGSVLFYRFETYSQKPENSTGVSRRFCSRIPTKY